MGRAVAKVTLVAVLTAKVVALPWALHTGLHSQHSEEWPTMVKGSMPKLGDVGPILGRVGLPRVLAMGGPLLRGASLEAFSQKKMCQYWIQDPYSCTKGEACTFAHGLHELQADSVVATADLGGSRF